MRNEQGKFEIISPIRPPKGLFSRIVKRLGLERELKLVKRHLTFFTMLLVIFTILSIFAFIGVRQVLVESSFGSFLSLIFSDPGMVVKYWSSFVYALTESAPGITAVAFIFSMAFLLLFIRFIVFAIEKLLIINKSINKQKHGYK